jgi:hypothetical protein
MNVKNMVKIMKQFFYAVIWILIWPLKGYTQEPDKYVLMMDLTLFDFQENTQPNHPYPSMVQTSEWSATFYDLSFWGIHQSATHVIKNRKNTVGGKLGQKSFEYVLGLAFSKYGSELPIPLGVWAHEAYHCAVLGATGLKPVNGNSLIHRWDGTVYGIPDEELSRLKNENPAQLLYSYVAGVQSEIHSTQTNVLTDFYNNRSFYKNALYLYNAWYVYNYFKFSTGSASDSVKILAPPHEDPDPFYRDFAGADLTAWVYDMYAPLEPYQNRDAFPNGDGVNRRIGFSDLSKDGQDFLKRQKSLSLLNLVNPSIFMINKIKVSGNLSFLFFMQYTPTHFGNEIAFYLPFKIKQTNQLFALHTYQNMQKSYLGLQYGIFEISPFHNKKILLGGSLNVWSQPENQSPFDKTGKFGGNIELQGNYNLGRGFSSRLIIGYKTDGWMIGNPYLSSKVLIKAGLAFRLVESI